MSGLSPRCETKRTFTGVSHYLDGRPACALVWLRSYHGSQYFRGRLMSVVEAPRSEFGVEQTCRSRGLTSELDLTRLGDTACE